MINRFICLLVAIVGLDAAMLFADEGASKGEGTLNLSKKTFQLKSALAYESATGGEPDLTVVLTSAPVSNDKLKKALAAEKKGEFAEFPAPYLKMVFKTTGELKNFSAVGGGTTIGGSSDGTGELKAENGRVIGKANAPFDASELVPKGFDVKFDVALHKSGEELPVAPAAKKYGPAANVKPTVTGTFKGNGKDVTLGYVSARWGEPFSGKTGIVLVFTEKDHSKARKPDFDASFGKFGSALIVSLHEDGDIYGCEVVHGALQKKNFSSVGSIATNGFTYADGKVEGELTTNGQQEFFGDTWEVKDLKFVAPLGEIPKEYQVADDSDEKSSSSKSEAADRDDEDSKMPSLPREARASLPAGESGKGSKEKASAGELNVKDLALTKDASDFEYKALVEQMSCKSKLGVKAACAELAKNLKAQGWKGDGSDLITANSSILKRKRGEAELTIFVKPDEGGGSNINLMTEGLSWDEK